MKTGKLFLIPTLLGEGPVEAVMPAMLGSMLKPIKHFIVEDLRTARRFLKKVDREIVIDDLHFELLNEHSEQGEIPKLLEPLLAGNDVGLMSEAGTPCVADPGSALVAMAHTHGIQVVPLSGPSSITLALMASGLSSSL